MCRQPCYQLDHIYSPQEACTHCHLHIYQFHATTASHCWSSPSQWHHKQSVAIPKLTWIVGVFSKRIYWRQGKFMLLTLDNDRIKLTYNNSVCSPIITACYGPESFLPSCIPLNRVKKKQVSTVRKKWDNGLSGWLQWSIFWW